MRSGENLRDDIAPETIDSKRIEKEERRFFSDIGEQRVDDVRQRRMVQNCNRVLPTTVRIVAGHVTNQCFESV